MGRVKLQIKKIENKTYRHITFAKRKSGLVKKAFELSTLCDVEIGLIIFSPAGKLILFDGKKRIEEILESYLNLPEKKRGRLHNEELVQRISTQMSLEASIHNHFNNSSGKKVSTEYDLEEIQNQILSCRYELENIERQIRFFVGSPNCIKTMSEVELHEEILGKALKGVQIRKQALEGEMGIQQVSEGAFNQEIESRTGWMMGSSSHSLNGPSQINPTNVVMDVADGPNNGFETFNQPQQPTDGIIQPSSAMLHGYNFPSNNINIQNIGYDTTNIFVPHSNLNSNFFQGMNIIDQGSPSSNAVRSNANDSAAMNYYVSSQNDHYGYDCGPFPF